MPNLVAQAHIIGEICAIIQIDGQVDGQADIHTDRRTEGQTNRRTDKQLRIRIYTLYILYAVCHASFCVFSLQPLCFCAVNRFRELFAVSHRNHCRN